MKLLIVTLVACTVNPVVADKALPPTDAVAVTSSAPAPVELAGDRIATAVPSARVSDVATLVTASPRATLKVTTCPLTGPLLASLRVAVSVAGLAELIDELLKPMARVGNKPLLAPA